MVVGPREVSQLVLVAFVFVFNACTHQEDASLLTLDGDNEKTCPELHAEYESVDKLSERNIGARQRWPTNLMRQKDCRLPKALDVKLNFHLIFAG